MQGILEDVENKIREFHFVHSSPTSSATSTGLEIRRRFSENCWRPQSTSSARSGIFLLRLRKWNDE